MINDKREVLYMNKNYLHAIFKELKNGLKLRHHRNISYSDCNLATRKNIILHDPLVKTKTLHTSHIISKPFLIFFIL